MIKKFTSPRNMYIIDDCYVDILFINKKSTYLKTYLPISENISPDTNADIWSQFLMFQELNPKTRSDPQPITSDDNFGNDFTALFNIGDKSYQNKLEDICKFHRTITFHNVFDRSTVKIRASFANQSKNYYVGNSHVYFNPIKYYKLNSNDDKFWIEFYNARNPDTPINIPDDENFVLEMLFLQNRKLLYT